MAKTFYSYIKSIYKRRPFFLKTFIYRDEFAESSNFFCKFKLLSKTVYDTCVQKRAILFYPDQPLEFHALYKVLTYLGYRITSNSQKRFNLAIKWWLAFDGNPFAPAGEMPFNEGIENGLLILNKNCNDISKRNINKTFEEVFGYPLEVDPRKYSGECVMKLNWNALHKGRTIHCPIESVDEEYVYQKLIRNENDDGLVEDMRVPVFGDKTPFIYLKYRTVKDRFVDRVHTNTKATIGEVADFLSIEELEKIHCFCKRIGMDYGEVDVLRDSVDERIYIVDANNTPSGPPSPISKKEGKIAVKRLSAAFEEAFGTKNKL